MKNRRSTTKFFLIALLCLFSFTLSPAQAQDDDPSLKEKKTKEGFLIDLKSLITRSKKKIEQANEMIEEQEQYERNQKREEKAREYYEKGMKLYEEGNYDKAAEYWERAVKITEHPEMEGYIRHSSRKTKKEMEALEEAEKRRLERLEKERGYSAKEVEKAYAKAVAYFKRERYLDAQEKFQEVEDMFPDHKATRSYLMLISQKIQEQQEELIKKKVDEESAEYRKQKENWKKELERKAKLRRKRLEEQADKVYKEAVRLYKTKQYAAAQEKFKEVEWILPNYKSTIRYLRKLDNTVKVDEVLTKEDRQRLFEKKLREERLNGQTTGGEKFEELQEEDRKREAQKRLEEEAEFIYRSAISLYKKKKYPESKDLFMEVEKIYPAFKKTRDYLSKIEKKIPEHQRSLVKVREEEAEEGEIEDKKKLKEAVLARREKYADEAEQKYKKALEFYSNRNYVEAKIKFIQVEALYPDYKDTRNYLAHIDDNIAAQLDRGDAAAIRGLEVAWEDGMAETVQEQRPPALPPIEASPENIKDLYKQAVRLYKDDHYELARDRFMQVNSLSPGYMRTESYLDKIYKQLAESVEVQEQREEKMFERRQKRLTAQFKDEAKIKYKEALKLYKNKDFVAARKKFVEVNELVPGYKSTKRYILRLNKLVPSIYYDEEEKEAAQAGEAEKEQAPEYIPPALEEELALRYENALSLYKDREFSKARKEFKRVAKLKPDYKMTEAYLSRIDKRLGPEAALMEEDLEEVTTQADERQAEVPDYRERKRDEKRERVAEKKSQDTYVRSIREQKKRLTQDKKEYAKQKRIIAQMKKAEQQRDLELYERQVNGIYKEALKLYKQNKYDLARRKFHTVDQLHPDYKSARHYIKQIDRIRIIKEEKELLQKEIEETRRLAEEAKKKAAQLKREAEMARKAKAARVAEREKARKEKEAERKKQKAIEEALAIQKREAAQELEAEKEKITKEKLEEIEQVAMEKIEEIKKVADGKVKELQEAAGEKTGGERTRERQSQEKKDSVDEDALIQKLAEEWKAAEQQAAVLEEELHEKELALRWRLHQEERIAQIMAEEEDLERLEKETYEDFRDKLESRYEEEEKALAASNERIEKRVEEIKKKYIEEEKMRERAAQRAMDALSDEREDFREARDRLVEVRLDRQSRPPEPILSSSRMTGDIYDQPIQMTKFDDDLRDELEDLESKIRKQESQLARDRHLAEQRLQKEKRRKEQEAKKRHFERIEVPETSYIEQRISFEERYRRLSEEENEAALERLIRARQRELREERERIRERFQESLEDLYTKAVDLHHAGMYEEAKRMFDEINIMAPGYKKTEKYLAKIKEVTDNKWKPKRVTNDFGQQMIRPSTRQLKTRDQMISNALDSLENNY